MINRTAAGRRCEMSGESR